jgi:peptide/nickel transport system permease protein
MRWVNRKPKDAPVDPAPYQSRRRAAEVWRRLKRNKGAMVSLIVIAVLILAAIFADVLYNYKDVVIKQNIGQRLQSPSWKHPFGTDELGRDILARVVHGSRISLFVGIASTFFSAALGILLGAIAGYYGGQLENVIMRVADVFNAIPANLLAVVVVAALGQNLFNLVIAIGICSVPKFVRVTRASVMQTRNQEYIEAESAIGTKNLWIILGTVLPNSMSPVFVYATLNIATAIISVSAMSFIGLGIPAPRPEWGSMLSAGRVYLRNYSYITMFPGLAIMLTILSFNMLGDGLRDALDPKTKR